MNEIQGIYEDGRVSLSSAVDWPDGTQVSVQPCLDEEPIGTILPSVCKADGSCLPWADTPEFRQALVAQMDSREPVELTPAEEAEWLAAREWIKEYTVQAVRREMGLER